MPGGSRETNAGKEAVMEKNRRKIKYITRKLLTLALTLTLALSFIPGTAAVNLLDFIFRPTFGPGKYSVYKVEIESTPVIFTVTYDPNDGDGGIIKVPVNSGDVHTVANQGYARDDYNFNGWNTEANGTGLAYTAGESITVTDDITLYAQWERITYTITYHSNGGTGGPDGIGGTVPVTVNSGDEYTVVSQGYTRTGFIFNGWNTRADGMGASYQVGRIITPVSDLDLYAQWRMQPIIY